MRILFISAFYPPYVVGGWEQLVADINGCLQVRGHATHVLTSRFGIEQAAAENGVTRVLHLESDVQHYRPSRFIGHKQRLRQNQLQTEVMIKSFLPDVVFVHVMWNLTWGVPWVAERLLPGRVVYYIANDWPYAPDPHTAYWHVPARRPFTSLVKQLLAPLPLRIARQERAAFGLQFEHVLCVSQAVKDNLIARGSVAAGRMNVVHNGVEVERFLPRSVWKDGKAGLALLYAGSITPHKGVHTAIAALAHLTEDNEANPVTLTIVGSGQVSYEAQLRQMVAEAGLGERVFFRPRVSREQMPALLQQFDALLLPSIWEEPLSRVMQEAMASGLIVIGTATGGTGEALVHGQTGLVFPPDDAKTLAARIQLLVRDPNLGRRLAANGRALVLERFTMSRMIDELEAYLADVVNHKQL